jgi:transposase-like protein
MAGLPGLNSLSEGRHFAGEVIVLCVRWYLRFKPSYRDLVEMMAERGLTMVHTTIMRRVHCYVPDFERRSGTGSHDQPAAPGESMRLT